MNDKNYNHGSGDNNNRSGLSLLRQRIASLSFGEFQRCVLLWLGAKGYRNICFLGRRSQRGRRTNGGADFTALIPGSHLIRVAIQVRHWQSPVQRRAVDELRGFMLRSGISSGMIITSNQFMPAVLESVWEYPGRPVELVSCARLAGSMAGLGLGACVNDGHLSVDEPYFRTLKALRSGHEIKSIDIKTSVKARGEVATLPSGDPEPWLWICLAAAGASLLSVWLESRGLR